MFWKYLAYDSSPVDWCEPNYVYSENIAEFYNTISNGFFLLLPPLLIYLHWPYALVVGPGIIWMWLLLWVVGLTSTYFHATLSLMGQLLDEISVLWVLMAGMAFWFPESLIPNSLQSTKREKRTRKPFIFVIFLFTVATTCLAFVYPKINAYCLAIIGFPAVGCFGYSLYIKPRPKKVMHLGNRCLALAISAIALWVCDQLFCDFWRNLGVPFLHGFWHVLISLAGYIMIVLFAYFDTADNTGYTGVFFQKGAKTPAGSRSADLSYWPSPNFEFGVPYVILNRKSKYQL